MLMPIIWPVRSTTGPPHDVVRNCRSVPISVPSQFLARRRLFPTLETTPITCCWPGTTAATRTPGSRQLLDRPIGDGKSCCIDFEDGQIVFRQASFQLGSKHPAVGQLAGDFALRNVGSRQ